MAVMKKCTGIMVFICVWGAAFDAQSQNVIELQAGYLDPWGTKGGLILSGSYGLVFDRMVDISVGVSYFHRYYEEGAMVDTTINGTGTIETRRLRELEHNTTLLPVAVNIRVCFPIRDLFFCYIGGGISYQFLFDSEKNHIEKTSDRRIYRGLGGLLRVGAEYPFTENSSVTLEILYNIGKVGRDVTESGGGLTEWGEVNVGGFGIRGGLRLRL